MFIHDIPIWPVLVGTSPWQWHVAFFIHIKTGFVKKLHFMKHFNGQMVTLRESRGLRSLSSKAKQKYSVERLCLPRTASGMIAGWWVTEKLMKLGDYSCLKVPMLPAEAHWGEGAVHLWAACRYKDTQHWVQDRNKAYVVGWTCLVWGMWDKTDDLGCWFCFSLIDWHWLQQPEN